MAFPSLALSSLLVATRHIGKQIFSNPRRMLHQDVIHTLSQKPANKQIEFISAKTYKKVGDGISYEMSSSDRPLVVLLTWMLARRKHVDKYCDIYLKRGYDVLTVSMSPWQFLWPTSGAQLIATDLLKYLSEQNKQPLILHGFSVGAYLWGEVLVKATVDLKKYSPLFKRVKGQIWDSSPDIAELHTGIPRALVPNNALLRATVEKYVVYHLKTFHNAVTQHYIRSSQLFHSTPIRAPTLILISKNDPIASEASNRRVKESWESLGIKTYWKCWDKSKHVSHYILHKEEYLSILNSFLASLDFNSDYQIEKEEIKAKL